MSHRSTSVDLYVLDALADDIEDLESILRLLNNEAVGWRQHWGREFERHDVVSALSRLVSAGQVQVYLLSETGKELVEGAPGALPPGSYEEVWFGLAHAGRIRHETWKQSMQVDE